MKFPFEGLMAPVFAPFNHDRELSLNLDIIPEYAKLLAKNGIHAVLVNGTSGEGMSMTVMERKAVVEAWMNAVQSTGQVVMVQVGGACLKDVKDMATHAEKNGVHGLLCLPDLFNKPTSVPELVCYLKLVASAAPSIPLLYYHLPAYTGVTLPMPSVLAAAAAQIPSFAGAKFTHTNLDEGAQCVEVGDGALTVFLGCDQLLAAATTIGFTSAIATTLNLLPSLSKNIQQQLKKGDLAEALQYQRQLTNAITAITQYGKWVPAMKQAMSLLTLVDLGPPRPPLEPITATHAQQMKNELLRINLPSLQE